MLCQNGMFHELSWTVKPFTKQTQSSHRHTHTHRNSYTLPCSSLFYLSFIFLQVLLYPHSSIFSFYWYTGPYYFPLILMYPFSRLAFVHIQGSTLRAVLWSWPNLNSTSFSFLPYLPVLLSPLILHVHVAVHVPVVVGVLQKKNQKTCFW